VGPSLGRVAGSFRAAGLRAPSGGSFRAFGLRAAFGGSTSVPLGSVLPSGGSFHAAGLRAFGGVAAAGICAAVGVASRAAGLRAAFGGG